MKKIIKKIIDYLWRWSNTKLTIMNCTFCGRPGAWTITRQRGESHFVCDNCYPIYKTDGLRSSYWGGLGHK